MRFALSFAAVMALSLPRAVRADYQGAGIYAFTNKMTDTNLDLLYGQPEGTLSGWFVQSPPYTT